jgi:hypothetical protein
MEKIVVFVRERVIGMVNQLEKWCDVGRTVSRTYYRKESENEEVGGRSK